MDRKMNPIPISYAIGETIHIFHRTKEKLYKLSREESENADCYKKAFELLKKATLEGIELQLKWTKGEDDFYNIVYNMRKKIKQSKFYSGRVARTIKYNTLPRGN